MVVHIALICLFLNNLCPNIPVQVGWGGEWSLNGWTSVFYNMSAKLLSFQHISTFLLLSTLSPQLTVTRSPFLLLLFLNSRTNIWQNPPPPTPPHLSILTPLLLLPRLLTSCLMEVFPCSLHTSHFYSAQVELISCSMIISRWQQAPECCGPSQPRKEFN